MTGAFRLGRGGALPRSELRAFLTETRLFVKVGTTDADGWPAVNPAWYEYDGVAFWLVTKQLAGFCQNMRRDPRVMLCVDNPEPPYKRVMVRGTAEFVDGDWVEIARRMVLRYLGAEGMDYFEATLDMPRVLIRIRPERISSWDGGGIDRTFTSPSVWHEVPPGSGLESVLPP